MAKCLQNMYNYEMIKESVILRQTFQMSRAVIMDIIFYNLTHLRLGFNGWYTQWVK